MTPAYNQTTKEKTIFLITLIGVVMLGGGLCVSKYVSCVSLNHDVYALDKKIEEMRVQNAELKSLLYKQTDVASLEAIAEKKGLVQDKNPQWAFVSVY